MQNIWVPGIGNYWNGKERWRVSVTWRELTLRFINLIIKVRLLLFLFSIIFITKEFLQRRNISTAVYWAKLATEHPRTSCFSIRYMKTKKVTHRKSGNDKPKKQKTNSSIIFQYLLYLRTNRSGSKNILNSIVQFNSPETVQPLV